MFQIMYHMHWTLEDVKKLTIVEMNWILEELRQQKSREARAAKGR